MIFHIDSQNKTASEEVSWHLKQCILRHPDSWSELVFLCIGSDKITGDCLGPYIGQQLKNHPLQNVYVYGTLKKPVHALNLDKAIRLIHKYHPQALIIAIDASLGQKKHLGYVTIGNGALYPGAGVQKNLPPVGDIYITGIVNTSGMMEQFTLQTTSLATVISLADTITQGILLLICKHLRHQDHISQEERLQNQILQIHH